MRVENDFELLLLLGELSLNTNAMSMNHAIPRMSRQVRELEFQSETQLYKI